MRDPFNPLGHYDPLFTANLCAHAAHLTGTEELDTCVKLVTTHAARVMGLEDYGLTEGARTDLVVLDTTRRGDAVTALPERFGNVQGRPLRGAAARSADVGGRYAVDLILRNARLLDGQIVDIGMEDGGIVRLEPDLEASAKEETRRWERPHPPRFRQRATPRLQGVLAA